MDQNLKMRGWPSIPHECTAIILGYLENDTYALAALAQVNKAFFRLVCPILYRDPFKRLEYMARVLPKPALEIAQEQLSEWKAQPSQCCENAKVTERVLESLALPTSERIPSPTKGRTYHQVPGYLDPAPVFAASPAVSWRYESLYRTLMEPILQILHSTYPSLHWPFLIHQHIRQLPMYDIPEDEMVLATAAASKLCHEDESAKDEMVDEGLFDQDDEPPCGGFDLGDDDDDDDSNSSGDEHTSTMVTKKRDYLQYLQVIDLAYFPTRFGGHHRHYHLHGPYQRVVLGYHSRFHPTNPTNAKIHRDYGLLYCIWDRSPKAVAFQHSLQKMYMPQSGVLDRIQRLLLARYPAKVQALRLPISRLTAFDLDPALFSAMAHRAVQPTPMPFHSAFIARRMTHLSRIEIHGLSQATEDWHKLREALAYLSVRGDPVHTIRELSIRSSANKVDGLWMRRVLAVFPKLEVLEVHGLSESTCLIHPWGERKPLPRIWTPHWAEQGCPQPHQHDKRQPSSPPSPLSPPPQRDLMNVLHTSSEPRGPSEPPRSWEETPSDNTDVWTEDHDNTVVAACGCHWLSTWPTGHGHSLRVLDIESSHSPAMQWRQYTDLARFPNLEELRLVGRDQYMFEWVLEGRELRRQQSQRPRGGSISEVPTSPTSLSALKQQQQQLGPQGTLDLLKRLSLVLHNEPVARVLIDRCPQTCPQLEVLILRPMVARRESFSDDEDAAMSFWQLHHLGTTADKEKADWHIEQQMVPALRGLTRLRSLWLEGTWFMSIKAVSAVVSELNQLHTLGLQACPNIKMSSTELKKMVGELRGGNCKNGSNEANKSQPLELRWINTDLPESHAWFWQETKILYDH
ncbi:hypothetical protein BGW41_001330 [Actinomortierella wolfii]|nr:hypothetical protein BGW41_001330 [Actinomortierella wolfii]